MVEPVSKFVNRLILSPSLLFWIAIQIPIFEVLNFLYAHRPVADPSSPNYDVRLYFEAATSLLNGQVPYRDFFFQYPPLSLLFFLPPRLVASDLANYFTWFNVELLVLACIGIAATASIARFVGQPVGVTLLLYSLGLLAIGAIIPQRYDLIPAVLVVLALAAWLSDRRKTAYVLLALGTLVKIYPALLFPLFVIAEWQTNGWRAAGRAMLFFSAMLVMGLLPFLVLAPNETLAAMSGQAGRGIGLGSLYASLMLAARPLGVPARIVYDAGLNTWNVQMPGGEYLSLVATGIQLAVLAIVYLRYFRTSDLKPTGVTAYSAATIALGVLASKVLSTQYVIWLFPVAFITGTRRIVWASALFLGAALSSQLLYPFLWTEMRQGTTLTIVIAIVRDLALVGLGIGLLKRNPSEAVVRSPLSPVRETLLPMN